MSTQTEKYKGYTIKITQDESPENPFESWDGEPPLLTFSCGRHSHAHGYNEAPESWYDILRMLPPAIWKRGQRMAFLKKFILPQASGLRNYAKQVLDCGGHIDACAEILGDALGAKPDGWGEACTWFETAEAILNYAGIPCLYDQSNGYSQGDSTLCFVVLTPEWFEKTGAKPEHSAEICKSAVELYSAWAWGDVYGISEIIAPGALDDEGEEREGEALEEGSVWGFYGSDHEKSGLMESAQGTIDWHIEKQAKEAQNITEALCSAE